MPTMTDDQLGQLEALASAVRPLVVEIETSPAMTKDHYDRYIAVIDRLARTRPDYYDSNPKLKIIIGFALIQAGASRDGVMAALRIVGAI